MSVFERAEGRLSRIVRAWEGETAVCIACGPSLTREQVDRCRGRAKVIVVNNNYLIAPWADVLYFPDHKWHKWHSGNSEYIGFAGEKCSLICNESAKKDAAVHLLGQSNNTGLSVDPGKICTGSNSGHQVINIVVLAGAALVLLLGYDAHDKGGKKHWFGDHPDKSGPPFEKMKAAAKTIGPAAEKLGVRIVNCTPGSALDCFERGELESLLPDPAAALVSA